MPNIWNSLTRTGSVGFDEIEEELRRRGIDPATVLGAGQGGGNPALPNTPLALSRMMPPQGGYDDGGGTRGSYPTSQTQAVVAATPDDTQYPYSGREDDPNGKGGLAATITPERSRRRSEVSGEELQMARDLPANEYKAKKKGWWRRLRAGIGDNLRSGGDWFTALTQGVSEAADPSQRAERIKERGVKKIWNRYSQDVQQEGVAANQAAEAQKLRNDQFEMMQKRNKPLHESITADDIVTEDEAALATAAGFPMLPYDASRDDMEWVNGRPMRKRQKGGGGYVRDASLPDKIEDVPTDTTITAGGKDITLPLKPGQAANMIATAAERAQRAQERVQARADEAVDKEYKDESEYRDDLRKWSANQVKVKGQRAKAVAALPKLRESRAELAAQQYDTTQIDKSIADMEGDIAEADELMKEAKPKKVIRKKSATSKGGKNDNVGTMDAYTRARNRLKGQK